MPAEYSLEDCGVFSVEGASPAGGRVELGYQALCAVRVLRGTIPASDVPEAWPHYSVRQRTSLSYDGLDTYLSFGIRHPEQIETLKKWWNSICQPEFLPQRRAWAYLRRLRRHAGVPRFPQYHPRRRRATRAAAEPRFPLKLISNMSLNYLSLRPTSTRSR
ncbi:hypothetical protein ACPA9J_07835 [Pseudomonas aeruginosa]